MPAATAEGLTVKFNSVDEIQEFVRTVNGFRGDVDLKQGRIVIDAKSVLGICSMDIEKGMQVQVYNGEVEELAEMIQKYLA